MTERARTPAESAKRPAGLPARETLPFDAYALAVSALKAPHGYAEGNGYVARRADVHRAELSLPMPGGGHRKIVFQFPETIDVDPISELDTNLE